jgi:ABC-type transport system involved in multi-copper enzyme maturation permease subunit
MSSRLRRLRAVAYNTYLESVRQRLFLGLVFFGFLLMAASLVLKDISVRQDLKILQDIGLAATEFFGALVAIFLGADLIGKDVERRTLHLLIVKPLSRSEFILGRYLGLCLTILTCVILMAAGIALSLLTAHGSFTFGLGQATFSIFLQLCLTGAISTFLSTTSSRSLALLGATVICVLGRLTDVLRNASVILEGFPDWLGKGLYFSLPNLLSFDLKTRAIYGDPIPASLLVDLLLYAFAYIAALLALAAIAFERRDLK